MCTGIYLVIGVRVTVCKGGSALLCPRDPDTSCMPTLEDLHHLVWDHLEEHVKS